MTAEIAAGGADKDGGNSCKKAFALDRIKDLGDAHQGLGAGLGGMAGVVMYCVGSATLALRKASRRSMQVPQVPQ